jgi:hypothetical protein
VLYRHQSDIVQAASLEPVYGLSIAIKAIYHFISNGIACSLSTSIGTFNSISMVGMLGNVHFHYTTRLNRRTTANVRIQINLYARTLHDWSYVDYM